MRLIGNILWLILGGLLLAASWAIIGLVLCITIVGIPLGIQAFKMAGLTLTPFGKTVEYGGGVGSVLINIIWFVLAGLWMAIGYILAGLLNCVTIIGIPFDIRFWLAAVGLFATGVDNTPALLFLQIGVSSRMFALQLVFRRASARNAQ